MSEKEIEKYYDGFLCYSRHKDVVFYYETVEKRILETILYKIFLNGETVNPEVFTTIYNILMTIGENFELRYKLGLDNISFIYQMIGLGNNINQKALNTFITWDKAYREWYGKTFEI